MPKPLIRMRRWLVPVKVFQIPVNWQPMQLAAGGHIHRQGVSETLLVFTNHRNLLVEPNNWAYIVETFEA